MSGVQNSETCLTFQNPRKACQMQQFWNSTVKMQHWYSRDFILQQDVCHLSEGLIGVYLQQPARQYEEGNTLKFQENYFSFQLTKSKGRLIPAEPLTCLTMECFSCFQAAMVCVSSSSSSSKTAPLFPSCQPIRSSINIRQAKSTGTKKSNEAITQITAGTCCRMTMKSEAVNIPTNSCLSESHNGAVVTPYSRAMPEHKQISTRQMENIISWKTIPAHREHEMPASQAIKHRMRPPASPAGGLSGTQADSCTNKCRRKRSTDGPEFP